MTYSLNDETLDSLFKQVLSIKEFLAIIMKECIVEYKNEKIETIINQYIESHIQVGEKLVHPKISGANTEINHDKKKTTFDINFYARLPKSKDKIGIIINIEAQDKHQPGYHMLNRAHYYNARNISNQYGVLFTDSNYDDIRKVISIWIILDPPKYKSDGINRYTMEEENIYGNIKENPSFIKKNSIVMVYLSKESKSKFIQLMNELRDRKLDLSKFSELLKSEYGYNKKINIESEVRKMCNFSQYVKNEARLEFAIEQLQKRMKKHNLTLLEAMEDLDYDLKDYDFYKKELNVVA